MNHDREALMREFGINSSHNVWDHAVDNFMSVEVIKEMTGSLPTPDQDEVQIMIDFLRDLPRQGRLVVERGIEFGSMYLTAKRFLYRHLP